MKPGVWSLFWTAAAPTLLGVVSVFSTTQPPLSLIRTISKSAPVVAPSPPNVTRTVVAFRTAAAVPANRPDGVLA